METAIVLPEITPSRGADPEPTIIDLATISVSMEKNWAEQYIACNFAQTKAMEKESPLHAFFPLTLGPGNRVLKAVCFHQEMTSFSIETWGRKKAWQTAVIDDGFAIMAHVRERTELQDTTLLLLGSHAAMGRYYQTLALQNSCQKWRMLALAMGTPWPKTWWTLFCEPQRPISSP